MNKPISKLISLLFGTGLVASTVLLSSCSKDDENENIKPEVEIPTEFSELTVEQNKQKLEDNGIQLVNNLTELKNAPGIKTTISFNHFLSNASLPEDGRVASNKAVKTMSLLSKFGLGKAKASDVLSGFRAKEDEEPGTPQEFFDELKGTYSYDAANEEWDFEGGGDKIVFKFPSTENGTTNNAEFAIYGLTTVQIKNNAAEYEGDLPTGLKADLTVSGTKQIEYSFTASYKSNGEPTNVKTSLTIGAFKFAFEAVNNTSEVSADYALTKNSTNLISFGAGADGNFNSDNIGDSEGPGDVVNKASAYFQIMNIKFAGEVNAKSLDAALESAATIEAEATAYNQHVTFVVFYADSKKKIADTEFYGFETEECYDWGGGEQYCYTDEIIDVRLIFADGSKADLENYTEVGFEDLQNELEAFIEELDADIEG